MQHYVTLDYETASACDLEDCGAWVYAEDPTTEILSLKLKVRGQMLVWRPEMGRPQWFLDICNDPTAIFDAHNCQFEKAIWHHLMVLVYGFPEIPPERWDDTMAACAYRAIPMALEEAVAVLRLPFQKDMEGRRFTNALSKPRKDGSFDRSPEAYARVDAYCELDVLAEEALRHRLGKLPPEEREVWLMDQEINQRGIRVDLAFIRKCIQIVEQASGPLTEEFRAITGLNPTQIQKFKPWLHERNVHLPDMQKATVEKVLGIKSEEAEEVTGLDKVHLTPECRRALEIRYLLNSASIKKLYAMERSAGSDGRIRGTLQYHGTGPGRWAGRLMQPQNFPRGTVSFDFKEADAKVEAMVAAIMVGDADWLDTLIGPPVETVASALRHAIVASPGNVLMSGDYVQIQARVVLAVAGQHDKAQLLGNGQDIYCDMASQIYKRPINKKEHPVERQVGKNSVLGLGFQMGWKKFRDKYGEGLSDDMIQNIVKVYRNEWAPRVPEMWRGLDRAIVDCVHGRRVTESHGVEYRLEDGWMTARLPSGRKMWYWNPQPVRKAMPWGCANCDGHQDDHPSAECKRFIPTDIRPAVTYQAKKMGRLTTVNLFGGQATENVVMGIERDIIVHGMKVLRKNGFPLILTVHDEVVCDVPEAHVDQKAFEQCMLETPDWVKPLRIPVAVESWTGERYRK